MLRSLLIVGASRCRARAFATFPPSWPPSSSSSPLSAEEVATLRAMLRHTGFSPEEQRLDLETRASPLESVERVARPWPGDDVYAREARLSRVCAKLEALCATQPHVQYTEAFRRALVHHANALRGLHRREDAFAKLQRARTLPGAAEDVQLSLELGHTQLARRENAQARVHFEHALRRVDIGSPSHISGLLGHSRCLAAEQEWEAAERNMAEVLEYEPEHVTALLYRCEYALQNRAPKRAHDAAEEALRLLEADVHSTSALRAEAHYRLAAALMALERRAEALAHLETAETLDESHVGVRLMKPELLRLLSEERDAQARYEEHREHLRAQAEALVRAKSARSRSCENDDTTHDPSAATTRFQSVGDVDVAMQRLMHQGVSSEEALARLIEEDVTAFTRSPSIREKSTSKKDKKKGKKSKNKSKDDATSGEEDAVLQEEVRAHARQLSRFVHSLAQASFAQFASEGASQAATLGAFGGQSLEDFLQPSRSNASLNAFSELASSALGTSSANAKRATKKAKRTTKRTK